MSLVVEGGVHQLGGSQPVSVGVGDGGKRIRQLAACMGGHLSDSFQVFMVNITR